MYLTNIVMNIGVLFCCNASDSVELQMFLCLDSMMQIFAVDGKAPSKLVYGYINGKKTECMSEYEFRERFSRVVFEKQRNSEPDSQKLLDISGLRRREIPMSAKESVYKGKKDLAGADLRGCDLKGLNLAGADLYAGGVGGAGPADLPRPGRYVAGGAGLWRDVWFQHAGDRAVCDHHHSGDRRIAGG